mmetsp:Transcript_1837/g.3697  ORF Transcript_1837/g.3697 Transcript_1837/m.3697 type:complete len:332 (+) Transcript_1837:27-1022(+)
MLSSNGRHFLDLGQGTRIVIVGGWSPGPLGHLEQVLLAERCRDVVKPKNMNLWMPPFPGIWCCNPYVVLVSFVLGATIYLSITADVSAVLRLSIVVLALGWGRLLAALVVRTSIESSIRIISREGLAKDIDHNKVFFIGFSWGGAIVAEMIARGMIGGLNQPFALLIAPTTSLVAKVALQKDVPTRIKELVLSPSSPPPPPPNNSRQKGRRAACRRVVLKNNEIIIPEVAVGEPSSPIDGGDNDNDEWSSKGEISDITEDYLHIPFSSPLYSKVLQAFREAATHRPGYYESSRNDDGGDKEGEDRNDDGGDHKNDGNPGIEEPNHVASVTL